MAYAVSNRGRKKSRKSAKRRTSTVKGRTSYRALVKKMGVKKAAAKWRSLSASKKIVKSAAKKTRKSASKRRSSSKLSAWQKFLKRHAGQGKTIKQLARLYKKGSASPTKRRASTKRRKATSKRRKGGLSKWQRFLKSHSGKGYTMKGLARMYKSGKTPGRKKSAAKRRRR